jgi:hypothetical protein
MTEKNINKAYVICYVIAIVSLFLTAIMMFFTFVADLSDLTKWSDTAVTIIITIMRISWGLVIISAGIGAIFQVKRMLIKKANASK